MRTFFYFFFFFCLVTQAEAQVTATLPFLAPKKLAASFRAMERPTDSVAINEVLITALRGAHPVFTTPDAIGALDSVALRRYHLRSTPEALAQTPGIFVQKTNHGGGSPFIRGLTGNQTLLLIDGIRLSNSTFRYGPNQYFNTLDVLTLDRIEVLRGGGSVQYGSDALGGTLQAFTRTPSFSARPDWQADLLGRWASGKMEGSGRGELTFSSRNVAVTGGLTYRSFGDLVGGDTTGRQSPSGYEELNYDLKACVRLWKNGRLTLAHQHVQQDDVPVYHKVVLENFAVNAFDPQRRDLTYARIEHDFTGGGLVRQVSATLARQETEEGRPSRKNGSNTLRLENDQVRTISAQVQVNTVFNSLWSANHGAEVYSDLVNSTREDRDINTGAGVAKRGLYPDDSRYLSWAVYSLHAFETGRWHATLGGRFNGYNIDVKDKDLGEVTLKPEALVWNAGLLYRLPFNTAVFASFNSTFRVPNIDDLGTLGIVDFRYEIPNYDLKPERSSNYQLGFRYQSEAFKGELFVFRNELRNLITRVISKGDTIQGYPVYLKKNVQEAYIQGLETALSYTVNRRWTAEGSLTYTYGQNITDNEPVRRIPPVFGRLALRYTRSWWSVEAETQAAAKQDRLAAGDKSDNRIPKGGTPGWQILNLHASLFRKNWGIQLSAVNLFDEDYRTHGSGINGAGRSVWVQLNIRL